MKSISKYGKALIILGIIWVNLQACGPTLSESSKSSHSNYSESVRSRQSIRNQQTENTKSPSIETQVKAFYQSAHFDFNLTGCEAPEDCPQSVGLITSLHDIRRSSTEINAEVSRCTAFQISSSEIVTNSHCIPREYKRGTHCGDYKISYRSVSNPQKLVSCQEIFYYSNVDDLNKLETTKVPDYAIIKLNEHIELDTFPKLSKKGIPENKNYQIYSVHNSSQNNHDLKIKKQDCQAVYQTSFLPDYQSGQYSRTTLEGCQVFKGNSGSPIFDPDQNVVGIIDSFIFEKSMNKNTADNSLLALGTNFSCLNLSDYSWEKHRKECPEKISESYEKDFKNLLSLLIPKLESTYLRVLNEIESYHSLPESVEMGRFEWMYFDHYDSDRAVYTYELLPICIRNESNWHASHPLKMSFEKGPTKYESGKKAFKVNSPINTLSLKRDQKFQAVAHSKKIYSERVIEISINPENTSANVQFYRYEDNLDNGVMKGKWVPDMYLENLDICKNRDSSARNTEIRKLKETLDEELRKFENILNQDSM